MNDPHQLEDVALDNENSLKALVRAIRLSQGQFRLILARCNYGALRDAIVQRLRELSPVPIREIVLPQSVKSLHATIKAELGDEVSCRGGAPVPALMVFGLESAKELKTVLKSSNYIREEFSKDFPFAVVLWVNDEAFKTLLRIAPDLESWATSVEFKLTTDELLYFLRQRTDELFVNDAIPKLENGFELEAACQDLQSQGQELEADLEASLEFVRGLDDFASNQIDEAIEHYQKSLGYWQQSPHLERQGILVLNIALCYYHKAEQNRAESRRYWEESKSYLQQCLEVFEQAERPDLVARHISKFGEILRRLQAWEQLKRLAEKALTLHQPQGDSRQVARDYGFLAEVALAQSRWIEANQLAQQALQILSTISNLQPHELGLYRFLLARSQEHLGQVQEAVRNLEQARQESNPQFNPQLYIDILGELRSLYFDQGEYLKAFEIKREQRSIEYQYGFQAFAGAAYLHPKRQVINPTLTQTGQQAIVAPEISASGRERDVKRLIERISSTHHKLIVIHGQSGVGKSSILKSALVPALKQQAIGERDALAVLVRHYTNWVRELERALAKAFEETKEIKLLEPLDSVVAISEQLRKNADHNLLTVLIFDQFEEFFFVDNDKTERRSFFEFLRNCLNIGFVKVILSLREDYLYYLLEGERCIELDAINSNILDKNVRYYLGNFSPEDARAVIQSLIERSQFYLQSELIDELVQDLAGELGEVRPIELQIVGAQLQEDKITTLEQYRCLGSNPKAELVEQYLAEVIKDCGSEDNRKVAQFVLYLLTDENDTRPLKTHAELTADLTAEANQLDLVLEILVMSGLVLLVPEVPADRYQLVHDYLVPLIRQQQSSELVAELAKLRKKEELNRAEIEQLRREKELLAELAKEQERRKFAEEQRKFAEEQSQFTEQQLRRVSRQRLQVTVAGVVVTVLAFSALGFAVQANFQRKQTALAEVEALSSLSSALLVSNNQLGALIESVKVGQQLKTLQEKWKIPSKLKIQALGSLQQAVYRVQERNRIEKHNGTFASASFSPDGKILVSVSTDGTVEFWSLNGTLMTRFNANMDKIRTLSFSPDGKTIGLASADGTVQLLKLDGTLVSSFKGHQRSIYNSVNSVSFSPDGKTIASANTDGTVKLWSLYGTLLRTLQGHKDAVNSVSFSPDGKTIASASADRTVKLWSLDGTLLRTLQGHKDAVNSVSFSPNGKFIGSASKDKTVKLWSKDGTALRDLYGHTDEVNSVRFSPDGKTIASASFDHTVKLWKLDGTLLKSLEGHANWVRDVSFSPDGASIASVSDDNTIKFWRVNSLEQTTLNGHTEVVTSVSFSPDGERLASASADLSVKLWSRHGKLLRTLNGHEDVVNNVSFSPDGKTIASASADRSVKLWGVDGKLLHTLTGHTYWVNSVSFSPDGKTIASASADKTVKLWSVDGKLLHTLTGHTDWVNSVSFSPDGEMLASASNDKTIKLWSKKATLLKTLAAVEGNTSAVNDVTFSPDGMLIASANADNTIKLWNKDGTLPTTLYGHLGRVTSVRFHPDGKTLVSASADNTLRFWSLEGTLLRTLEGYDGSFNSVRFSPDSQTIASASDNEKIVILWNFNLDDLLVRGCDGLRDYLNNPNANISPAKNRHLCDDISTQTQK